MLVQINPIHMSLIRNTKNVINGVIKKEKPVSDYLYINIQFSLNFISIDFRAQMAESNILLPLEMRENNVILKYEKELGIYKVIYSKAPVSVGTEFKKGCV